MLEIVVHLSEDYLSLAEGEELSETDKLFFSELVKLLLREEDFAPVKIVLENKEELEARAFQSENGWFIVPQNLKFIVFFKEGVGVERIVPLKCV